MKYRINKDGNLVCQESLTPLREHFVLCPHKFTGQMIVSGAENSCRADCASFVIETNGIKQKRFWSIKLLCCGRQITYFEDERQEEEEKEKEKE